MTVLREIIVKRSSGADEVPCSPLKDCAEILSQPLAKIINNSLKSGWFPIRIPQTIQSGNNFKKGQFIKAFKQLHTNQSLLSSFKEFF